VALRARPRPAPADRMSAVRNGLACPWLRTASILLAGRGGVWLTLLPPLCWSKKCRGKSKPLPAPAGKMPTLRNSLACHLVS
jgi:hypothetical protein